MEFILNKLLERPHNRIVRLTKFWVFALEHRNEYEKEAGRKLTPVDLKERASIPWESVDATERVQYHLKAKALNREAKRLGLRFKNNAAKKRRRLTNQQSFAEVDEDLSNDVDFFQCLMDNCEIHPEDEDNSE